ncbi:MAG: single-stranded DNA-binding protein [Myxococcales bacterium]|nr:single-stranded DNA-binding protein [Myxococcales bacterium]
MPGPSTPDARIWRACQRLNRELEALRFADPVTHVYNPLRYAQKPHRQYLRRYAQSPKRVLYLGMNPGPYGMAQTGVPFGEIAHVRDWLGIEAPVERPDPEHPKRPIQGFACPKSEVSGARLWGALKARHRTPEHFFREHFIANYCPLIFMEESGKNRTPDKLPAAERDPLFEACDSHLRALVNALEPSWVIGVGKFAEARARAALKDHARAADISIATVLHPSPASPLANRGWAEQAERQLQALGLSL